MASFKDIHITYAGINPYGVLRFAIKLLTCSGEAVVDLADKEFIMFTLRKFNEDNLDELKRKLTAMADFQDAKTFEFDVREVGARLGVR